MDFIHTPYKNTFYVNNAWHCGVNRSVICLQCIYLNISMYKMLTYFLFFHLTFSQDGSEWCWCRHRQAATYMSLSNELWWHFSKPWRNLLCLRGQEMLEADFCVAIPFLSSAHSKHNMDAGTVPRRCWIQHEFIFILKTHIDRHIIHSESEIITDKLCINLSNWVFICTPVSFFGLLWFNGLEMIFNYWRTGFVYSWLQKL